MALRRGHFSKAEWPDLEKRKGWHFIKTAAESQREREIRAATSCRFMLSSIKTTDTEEADLSCKVPVKDRNFEGVFGHSKGQTPEREVTVLVNP